MELNPYCVSDSSKGELYKKWIIKEHLIVLKIISEIFTSFGLYTFYFKLPIIILRLCV